MTWMFLRVFKLFQVLINQHYLLCLQQGYAVFVANQLQISDPVVMT